MVNRTKAAGYAREMLKILDAGRYTSASGRVVDILDPLTRAIEGTVDYSPDDTLPTMMTGAHETRVEVANESTLAAARRLAAGGFNPAALNFASAKNPGGGFLNGARAQEESLAWSSGLYACIQNSPMYPHHRAESDALYTSWVIYSPGVPVVRDDEGALLDEPFTTAFLTSPAVNAGVALERDRRRRPAIRAAMQERVSRVLAVAASHGHDALVLGAWGCGVFKNDPEEIAELFDLALRGPFKGAFARVIFAVLDWSEEKRFIGPFERRFGRQTR